MTKSKVQQKQKQLSEGQHELIAEVVCAKDNSDVDRDLDHFQVPYLGMIELEAGYVDEAGYEVSSEFTETPLEDLLAVYTQERFVYDFASSSRPANNADTDIAADSIEKQGKVWPVPPDSEQPFTTLVDHTRKPVTTSKSRSYSKFRTSSLKRRLSQYSSLYLKTIEELLKTHSILNASNKSFSTSYCNTITSNHSTTDNSTLRAIRLLPSSVRVFLADAALLLDNHIRGQGICLPGFKTHDSRSCWCLAEFNPATDLWVHRNGLVVQRLRPFSQICLESIDLGFKDVFGNTALHILAARGAHEILIWKAIEAGVDGNAKNAAGQTFLHVFSPKSFQMDEQSVALRKAFLQLASKFNIKFHECDPFGRSFFHLLTRYASESGLEKLPVGDTELVLQPTRDAFGWFGSFGLSSSQGDHRTTRTYLRLVDSNWFRVPYHRYTTDDNDNRSANDSASDQPVPRWNPLYPSQLSENEAMVYNHARLVETAWMAIDIPSIQDSCGRNGLQCLAEASLDLGTCGQELSSYKRKRGQSSVKVSPTGMRLRFQLAKEMIDLGVDVNNYDEEGSTVLMTFVTHLSDGEDNRTLAELFDLLLNSGADIHRRSRQGETALHIAVRFGRKIATRILLARGANVHARTMEGQGVLATGEKHYLKARNNPPLYASIMACMALCRGFHAVAAPTWIQEWSMKKDGFT